MNDFDKQLETLTAELRETAKAQMDASMSIRELVTEMKYYRQEMDEIKLEQKDVDHRLRTVETKMPLIDEWRASANKVIIALISAVVVAAVIGGLATKLATGVVS